MTSFHVISCEPADIHTDEPFISGNTVHIPFSGKLKFFPITIKATYTTEGKVVDVLGDNPAALVFENEAAVQTISLIAESGLPITYTIKVEDKRSKTSILNFEVASFSPAEAEVPPVGLIDHVNNTITLMTARQAFPLTVTPAVTLPEGSSLQSNAPLVFDEAATTRIITVEDEDGEKLDWTVRLSVAPQLPNSDFNQWFHAWPTPNDTKEQIGTSATDMYWCTTNDPFAGFETTKVAGEEGGAGDYAAQLRTNLKDVLGIRKLGSAGLFTGFFKLNLSYIDDPERMTAMGRPFLMRPKKVVFSAKYKVGAPYYVNDEKTNTPIAAQGDDEGSCRVRVEHWTDAAGNILYNYTPTTFDEYEAVTRTVLGDVELLIGPTPNWTNMEVLINYLSQYQSLPATHIILNFASSQAGAFFRGADGSTLTLDNVKLVYD
jgi:hypothetical protein